MDHLTEEMRALAEVFQAQRLCLFGSRARGDFRPDSDYDFALWGVPAERQPQLLSAVDELPSLHKIDVVFVDQRTAPALVANIEKDGVVLMDKFTIKRENFQNAVRRLKEGLAGYGDAVDKQLAGTGLSSGLSSPASLHGRPPGSGCWTRDMWSSIAPRLLCGRPLRTGWSQTAMDGSDCSTIET